MPQTASQAASHGNGAWDTLTSTSTFWQARASMVKSGKTGRISMGKSVDDTHEWRKLKDFREGDSIYAWGSDMLVTRVKADKMVTRIFYVHDGEEKVKV